VDLGGGITERRIMNGIVAGNSARVGGLKLDEAGRGLRAQKYGLVIGEPTSEWR
jgi:actin-like ATPase involved in cell morphogenesis